MGWTHLAPDARMLRRSAERSRGSSSVGKLRESASVWPLGSADGSISALSFMNVSCGWSLKLQRARTHTCEYMRACVRACV